MLIIVLLFSNTMITSAQVTLNADNVLNNTYELINAAFAPGYTAIESPDQTPDGTHSSFGRHIAEVFDTDLNKKVFEFYSHVAEDNDVTGGLVRQRVEIKTYAASPDNLKGTAGETVVYKWRFKVPLGFQSSSNFTHIHQVKAVDGDDSSPLFTLTPRKGSPNKMQLIYGIDSNGSNDYKAIVDLSLFEGIWVETTETIKIGSGTTGTYAITIKKVSDGTPLLAYSNNNIGTIRTAATDPNVDPLLRVDNSFIRPKWGIYRSLADSGSLRDDSIRFSDFSISEIITPTAVFTENVSKTLTINGKAGVGTTVIVTFPDATIGTATANAITGAYTITSVAAQPIGNIVVSSVDTVGNMSPSTTIQYLASPSATSSQTFGCGATIASLIAIGTALQWYKTATGGSALATNIQLTSQTYYVSQTVSSVESSRTPVLVTVAVAAPTTNAQNFCGSFIVANLVAVGTSIQWYATETGGSPLATSATLVTGLYYVSQTILSCESARTVVAVTVCNPDIFRSRVTGNWNTPTTWQVRASDGTWLTATTLPNVTNNVYIQNGHTITVNAAEAYCYDLHLNTSGILTISGTNNVNVNGKIRAYTGVAETTTTDGSYTGTSTVTMASAMLTTASIGVLKFVGASRAITASGEWNSSQTSNNTTFALDPGAIGTLATGIKFKKISIASGTVSTNSAISAGSSTGDSITVKNGATLVSSRNGQVIGFSSTAICNLITIESGGTLELTGAAPLLDCITFANNGTVIYSGATSQTLLKNSTTFTVPGTPITSYGNLTISGTGSKMLPTNTNVTVNGALNFSLTGNNIVTGTNSLTLGTAASIIGAGTGWVVGNLIKQTASNASPSFTFAIGDATNYTPIALTFSGNTTAAGTIMATITATEHPQLVTSDIDGNKSVNRYWSLTNSGLAGFGSYAAAFTFTSGDNDPSSTPANYIVRKYETSAWSALTTSGTSTISAIASGVTAFGDFAIGESLIPLAVIDQNFQSESLRYYPNPVDSVLSVVNSKTISEIQVYDLLGQLVLKSFPNAKSSQIDFSGLPKSTYCLEINADDKKRIIKVIKK